MPEVLLAGPAAPGGRGVRRAHVAGRAPVVVVLLLLLLDPLRLPVDGVAHEDVVLVGLDGLLAVGEGLLGRDLLAVDEPERF